MFVVNVPPLPYIKVVCLKRVLVPASFTKTVRHAVITTKTARITGMALTEGIDKRVLCSLVFSALPRCFGGELELCIFESCRVLIGQPIIDLIGLITKTRKI